MDESVVDESVVAGLDQPDWSDLAGSSVRRLARLFTGNHTELLVREARVVLLAAAWADAHDLDPDTEDYQPLIERSCAWGGEGTPAVSEYCAAELGALQGTGMIAARGLIADALDLRHRFPLLWARLKAGEVRAWQARKVAEASRQLSYEIARNLDDALAGQLGMLPWPRFQKLLQAKILEADPETAAERSRRTKTERDVTAYDTEDGLKLVVARAASGDVTWFMATVNRIAEILAQRGDTDPVGVRRSKAVGLIAQPAIALQLLLDHRDDPADPSDVEPEPADPEPGEDDGHASLRLTPLPAGADLKAARPRVVLHFHLSQAAVRDGHGVVRPEQGEPITLDQLYDFLRDSGCTVQLRPVLDPAHLAPVDGYEIPERLRFAMRLRHPTEVFPYGSCSSVTADLDHTVPYQYTDPDHPDQSGPPGQTGLGNLGPLGRSAHRAVTHGRWQRRQPEPGRYLFRSPTGYHFLVTNQGTQPLGNGDFAQQIWHVAAPAQARAPAA